MPKLCSAKHKWETEHATTSPPDPPTPLQSAARHAGLEAHSRSTLIAARCAASQAFALHARWLGSQRPPPAAGLPLRWAFILWPGSGVFLPRLGSFEPGQLIFLVMLPRRWHRAGNRSLRRCGCRCRLCHPRLWRERPRLCLMR